MKNIIRIANGQGFWGDSIDAPANLLQYGKIDYLTLDYLAEVTISIMQKQKIKNPLHGYAKDFVDLVLSNKKNIKKNNIKIITNAGGVNPLECASSIKSKLNDNYNLKIGVIQGDDIYNIIDDLIESGQEFKNLETGEHINKIRDSIRIKDQGDKNLEYYSKLLKTNPKGCASLLQGVFEDRSGLLFGTKKEVPGSVKRTNAPIVFSQQIGSPSAKP